MNSDAVASSSSYEEPVPETPEVEAGLTVRPNVLVMRFAFRQDTQGLEEAVPKLKAAVDRYVRAVTEASKAEVSVKLRGFALEPAGKVGDDEALAHGVLEVALSPSLDFWGRAALVATLERVGRQEAGAAEKANGGLSATFNFPVAQVRDPESHRAELMKRWVERTRGFTTQAQSERAPLHVVGCEVPGEVRQQPVSVDEVVLSLAVSCRLDAVEPK
jgi:hypothetical protein